MGDHRRATEGKKQYTPTNANNKTLNYMKKIFGLMLALAAITFIGCTEQVGKSARYVFKERTITDYL